MSKKRLRDSKEGEVKLNITSMMDMFTIILIFLLKSYSVNPVNITPNDKLRLPSSTSQTAPEEGLSIAILKDKVVLDKKDLIPMEDGKINRKYLASDGKTILLLEKALKKELEKSKFIAKNNKDYKFKGTIVIQADKTISFKTLKKIMYTTGVSGYSDFRFAVVSND
jgi:biopolymer transport protein ExbD